MAQVARPDSHRMLRLHRHATNLLSAAEHVTERREVVAAGLTTPQPAWERSSSDIVMMIVLTHATKQCCALENSNTNTVATDELCCTGIHPCGSTPVTVWPCCCGTGLHCDSASSQQRSTLNSQLCRCVKTTKSSANILLSQIAGFPSLAQLRAGGTTCQGRHALTALITTTVATQPLMVTITNSSLLSSIKASHTHEQPPSCQSDATGVWPTMVNRQGAYCPDASLAEKPWHQGRALPDNKGAHTVCL